MSIDVPLAAANPGRTPDAEGRTGRKALTGGADLVELHEGLYRLPTSPDPRVVFAAVAALLVPALCDEASADVYRGARLARWQDDPPATDGIPTPRRTRSPLPDGRPDGLSVIVHVSSLPPESDGWTGEDDYVVALTCDWQGADGPTGSIVALIKIMARYGAAVVHQAQQAELIGAQEIRIRRLEQDR